MKKDILNCLIHKGSICALCLFMVFSALQINVFAENEEETGLCEHHTVHTDECGYQEGSEEIPCNHICDEECYEIVIDCVMDDQNDGIESKEESLEHICTEESGCIKKVNNCVHVHDETCGYQVAIEPSPCNYVCTECIQDAKVVSSWKWVDPEEMLVWDENSRIWGLGLPGTNADNLLTGELLSEFLPKEVEVEMKNGDVRILPLTWDLSSYPFAGAWSGTYTVTASIPDEFVLSSDASSLCAVISLGDGTTMALLTEEQLKSHIVSDVVSEIDGVQVNLFDYWVLTENPKAPNGDILTKSDRHIRQKPSAWGNTANYSASADWWNGINKNHLLIFGDGVIHAGLWNKGAGEGTDYGLAYAGMEGIVQPLLEDGYPLVNTSLARKLLNGITDPTDPNYRNYELIGDYKLAGDHINSAQIGGAYPNEGSDIQNLSNTLISLWENGTGKSIATGKESLAYLFDPNVEDTYKKTYQNILGLFQIDDDGYYYYNMRENFAEFKQESSATKNGNSDGRFVLYDAPATLRSDGTNSVGNFFPFNKGTEVFDGIAADGSLTSAVACSSNAVNHHMGMTVNVDFRQPINGMINMGAQNRPMTFSFSGDDDVWIYIDDVLVLDLGGVHSEIYGIIDFASGNVLIGQSFKTKGIPDYDPQHPENTEDLVSMTTLRELYRAAGKENEMNWNGNTFASNSDHHLKMFYLERGNYDSSLSLRFNLQPRLYQQIKKVDQNGDPINGVEFKLYEAKVEQTESGTSYSIKDETKPLATLVTGKTALNEELEKGNALFEEMDSSGAYRPFNFADRWNDEGIKYYILKEQNTPKGYRPIPVDIILEYNPESTMLRVVNRYITGAYASFTSTITGNSKITYGSFDTGSGAIEPSDVNVTEQKQKDGLVIAIPMMWQENFGESGKWTALYGSNTGGLGAITPQDRTAVSWRKAVLTAVLHQCSDENERTPSWYLSWNDETKRLEGSLNDLPGRADRYQLNNTVDPDMKMVYMLIDPEVFTTLNIKETTAEGRYEALGTYVLNRLNNGDSMDQIVDTIYQIKPDPIATGDGFDTRGISFLNVDQFIRNFRSLIYIPNEQRELRVWKIDQDGKGLNGAEFSLYDNPECKGTPAAVGTTDTVDGLDGTLIFAPYDHTAHGHAKMEWASSANEVYYLKETKAPDGYEVNPEVVRVIVGIYSIYADAGKADDGIKVMAGVGKLTQTMVKYAADENVNITLRDITAVAQSQNSDQFDLNGWKDICLDGTQVERIMNLHYGINAMVDYGLHDEDGGKNLYPFFVADTGFIRARVEQNYDALKNTQELNGAKPAYTDDDTNNASKDYVEEDITSLFSLLNIVVVTDQSKVETRTGQLMVGKKVLGSGLTESDYTRNFDFKITLKDKAGNPLTGKYYFYGTDKSGYLESGEVIPFHHDESIIIMGIPEGTTWSVEELNHEDWFVNPESGILKGEILYNQTAEASFINSKTKEIFENIGNLSVRKTVEGDKGDLNKEFTFTIVLQQENGATLPLSYSYEGDKQGTLRSGDQITLKHGQSITIKGLPAGTKYTVTEVEANQDGYSTSIYNAIGVIEKNKTAEVSFVNRKGVVTTDKGTDVPDTGDHSHTRSMSYLFILSAICLSILTMKKKKFI